jgi:uncharacterized protein YegP (UPF0339 family)
MMIPTSERTRKMEIEYYKDKDKKWRWRAKAENGEIVADSAEGYENKQDIVDEVQRLRGDFPGAVESIEGQGGDG